MYSILCEVDRHIKEKNILLRSFSINYSYFPKYFNQAIVNELRKIDPTRFELGPSEYELLYDDKGNLCLFVRDTSDRMPTQVKKIAISNYAGGTRANFAVPATRRSEEEIVENACMLEFLEDKRAITRRAISLQPDLSPIERVKIEYQRMSQISQIAFEEIIKTGGNILDMVDYQEEYKQSVDKIISYIDYLWDYYQEDVKTRKRMITTEQ